MTKRVAEDHSSPSPPSKRVAIEDAPANAAESKNGLDDGEAKQQDEVLGSKSTEQIQSAAEEEPLKEKESPDMSGNEDAKEEVVEEKAQEEKNKEDLPSVTAEVAATSDCAAGADAPKGFGLGFGGFQSSATANNNSEGGGFFGFTTAASSNPFTSLVQGDGGGWGSSSSAAAPQVEEAPDEKKESVQGLLNPSDVVNGEEGEDCVLQLRAKLYRLDSEKATGDGDDGATAAVTSEVPPKQEWKEVGTGPVRVLRQKGGAAERLVMRRENHPGGVGTKVLLNAPLRGKVHAAKQAEKALRFTHFEAAVPVTYLIKLKLVSEADTLLEALSKHCSEDADEEQAV